MWIDFSDGIFYSFSIIFKDVFIVGGDGDGGDWWWKLEIK